MKDLSVPDRRKREFAPWRSVRCLIVCLLGILWFEGGAVQLEAGGHALVYGNGDYAQGRSLPNAENDAVDFAAALKKAGWQVTLVKHAGVKEMHRTLRLFCETAAGSDSALVFFAGHGIEVKGKNYLLPTDVELSDGDAEDALPLETLALEKVIRDLVEAKIRLKVVVLDCCRNDPISRSWLASRSAGGGLAEVKEAQLPEGAMLVFSTAPGLTALDGVERNSPFTSSLLKRMASGGGSIADVFGDVANDLGKRQPAWIRFDGSGTSFAAFRNYPLVPGSALQPSSESANVSMLEKKIEELQETIEDGKVSGVELIALRSKIRELERDNALAKESTTDGNAMLPKAAAEPSGIGPKITVAGVEMTVIQAVQSTSDVSLSVTIKNTTNASVSIYAGNTNTYTAFDFREDQSQWQQLSGQLLGNNGDQFRLLNVGGMELADRSQNSGTLFKGQNYSITLAPGETAPLVLEYGARGMDQFTQTAPATTVTGILEARIVSSGSVSSRGFGFSNLPLGNRSAP